MHFIRTAALAALFCLPVLVACNNTKPVDADPFDTMQLCFDEHHTEESLSANDAIVVCCLDHPIAGVHPSCGSTVADCTGRLEGTDPVGMLTQTADVTLAAIMNACQDYFAQKGPTATGTVCADPDSNTLSYDNFGKAFMSQYCTMCHDSHLPYSLRNGAPVYHDFDTLFGVLEVPDHIDREAGFGPNASNTFMPTSQCPSVAGGPLNRDCQQPTDEERGNLAMWIACERKRPHDFSDAGVAAP